MYDQNEGLGAAMAESHANSRIAQLEARVAELERQARVDREMRNRNMVSGYVGWPYVANSYGPG